MSYKGSIWATWDDGAAFLDYLGGAKEISI